jgi:hypothetical protein
MRTTEEATDRLSLTLEASDVSASVDPAIVIQKLVRRKCPAGH